MTTFAESPHLFTRITTSLDSARERVVRSVNQETVVAYWRIGREIVEELQGGEPKAAYGKCLLEGVTQQLYARYGSGYLALNLWLFRQFYLRTLCITRVNPDIAAF